MNIAHLKLYVYSIFKDMQHLLKHRVVRNRAPGSKYRGGKHDASWSPYGCHYYPDPSEFPDPNVSTLPDEPLSAGEQYYLDLAGNIKKVNEREPYYFILLVSNTL